MTLLAVLLAALCLCANSGCGANHDGPQSSPPSLAAGATQPQPQQQPRTPPKHNEDSPASTSDSRDKNGEASDNILRGHTPITVEARGHEFHWEFFTVGPDGRPNTGDERSLGNDLPTPPDTLVTLILSSDDYVYTLNTPDGRIAAAVPDMIHTIQFLSPGSGRHEFRTDPMCGLRYFHDDVLGTMSIVDPDPRPTKTVRGDRP